VHGPVFLREPILDGAKARSELIVRFAERGLRIETELARQIGDREQEVPKLFGGPSRALVQGLPELACLLVDLVHDVNGLRPFESHRRDARANLVRS